MAEGARPLGEVHDAFEALDGAADVPVFLTCEHASERLPPGYEWHARDLRLLGSHWAYDLGAAALVRELSAVLSAPAVLARFSRLLVDPNRAEGEETLFRTHADGEAVELNRDLAEAERAARLERFHRPYHAAVDRRLGAHRAEVLLSIHTFTPVYEGARRAMEIGVLFDTQDELAARAERALAEAGFVTAMNEPYSGKAGLIYAAERHAGAHGRRALELELRQDLATRPEHRARLVAALAGFFL
jgi:predicted N-formylglutamate amidohydrolase